VIARNAAVIVLCFFASLLTLAGARCARAQAPAGPMAQPPASPSSRSKPAPKPPEIKPRTTLAGAWKFNRAESDDPRKRPQDKRDTTVSGSGGGYPPGSYPGGGYPGGGYPGGGYPGGNGPWGSGAPFPGSGHGLGGPPRSRGGKDPADDPKLQQVIQPAQSLEFEIKTSEVDVTDEAFHKLVFITDGRQLQKPKDDSYQEIAARWEGSRLVSDEKTPQGGRMSRTYELSPDGRQFFQTVHMELKGKTSLDLRYVYDINAPEQEDRHDSDPDRPVMKRHPADSAPATPAQ